MAESSRVTEQSFVYPFKFTFICPTVLLFPLRRKGNRSTGSNTGIDNIICIIFLFSILVESQTLSQRLQCLPDQRLCVQVIEEIEEMMQDSPDPEDDESPSQSDLSMLSQDLGALRRSGSNTSYEDRECSACSAVYQPASNYAKR